VISPSDIALTGLYEVSKILNTPNRLETTLSSVVNLLPSFVHMRHAVISLRAAEGIPDISVGAGWNEGSDAGYRAGLPRQAVAQIVNTAVPLLVESVAGHPLFSRRDLALLGADEETKVSFLGVPIRIGARVVGTLTIDRVWDSRAVFRLDADIRVLTMIANLIGQTVQLQRIVLGGPESLIAEGRRAEKAPLAFKPRKERKKRGGAHSPVVRALLDKVTAVAKSRSPVLLRGQSSDTELIAKAIHDLSARAGGPFVAMNCAALPESSLDAEVFGSEKDAVSGASGACEGRVALADKGTVFLDEITALPASLQAKLMRLLKKKEFARVGGDAMRKVDVRVIAATHQNLEEAVLRKAFRADLYEVIGVLPLILPPLRDSEAHTPATPAFEPGALDVLMSCYFPGTVRGTELASFELG
jgi:Nif-specific regulatory protein